MQIDCSEDQKSDLIEGYFCYPIKENQNTDLVFERLAEFHETSISELAFALKNNLTLTEFYYPEVRNYFVENGVFC